ncbi:hypothetical protein ENH_00000980 [Eimeria necatrix]|uniref:Reverse transcriptase, related n=1 Tax=Eimeria necatrix TaxID=51315 RepID=U6MPZ1_9EIME|nr:hypothetical protein ENH_00000980 [Eimeria necatrix]CDJ65143.1 hypothetical protein ENH_00000980 [Eimeria necatrix]
MMCAVATGPNAIPVSHEMGNQLLRTAGGTYKSDERAEGTQPLPETRRESGSESTLSEETSDATMNSSRKSAEATEDGNRDSPTVVHPRTPAEQAYEILAKQVAGMSAEEAAVFLRPPPRRYKSHAKTKAKARITSLVRQAADDTNDLRTPLHGLHLILALPEACSAVPLRLSDEWQGALCCALIGSQPMSSGCRSPLASTASVTAESDEESPWPIAKLEHTLFDEWINSTEAQDIPCGVAQMLHEYRAVFPDTLPKGLPPKCPHDHHILLSPGKLLARSAIYRMTPDQLTFHKQEIAELSENGWVGPTNSTICSPTIMVNKRDDGSGERKTRMVVNYQALNALTIAPALDIQQQSSGGRRR